MAGPGQSPPRPQPSPNKNEPRISLASIVVLVGMHNFSASKGF